jgi:hypothetical protein
MYRMECTSFLLNQPIEGIYYGQNEGLDTINNKLYERNITATPLRPNMDARSIPTRNTVYPVYDQRKQYKKQYLDYSTDSQFAPMQSNAPPAGFKVDMESQLRNQYFALQHGAIQGVYIPDSSSDLYKVRIPSQEGAPQPFPNLFHVPRMTTAPPPLSDKIGLETFHNCTKTQLRIS